MKLSWGFGTLGIWECQCVWGQVSVVEANVRRGVMVWDGKVEEDHMQGPYENGKCQRFRICDIQKTCSEGCVTNSE